MSGKEGNLVEEKLVEMALEGDLKAAEIWLKYCREAIARGRVEFQRGEEERAAERRRDVWRLAELINLEGRVGEAAAGASPRPTEGYVDGVEPPRQGYVNGVEPPRPSGTPPEEGNYSCGDISSEEGNG